MSTHVYTLGIDEPDHWMEILQCCGTYDVYHLPEYHQVAEEQGSGHAVLFVCKLQPATIAMPMLLREVESPPGKGSSEYNDVTSVYGYPGPVSNLEHLSPEARHSFARSLRDFFESQRIVAAFSRLNPLLHQATFLQDLGGEVVEVGTTVAIDLSLPVDLQFRQYRKNHRDQIKRARREGVTCTHDQSWYYLDTFVDIYYDTMRRVGADNYYFFDRAYFARLRTLLGNRLHLFVALKEERVISGALIAVCNSTIQYHLAATDSRYLDLAPSKLILDTVRLWSNQIGAGIFHLGGGTGAKKDSLFHFKAGFSRSRYQFKVWRLIVNQPVYRQLVEEKHAWNNSSGLEAIDSDYFPAYRCPTQTISPISAPL